MSSNKSADYPCIGLTAPPSGLLQMLQKTHSHQGLQMKKYNRQSPRQKMIAQNEKELSIHAGFGGWGWGRVLCRSQPLTSSQFPSQNHKDCFWGKKMVHNSSPSQAFSQIFSSSQKLSGVSFRCRKDEGGRGILGC